MQDARTVLHVARPGAHASREAQRTPWMHVAGNPAASFAVGGADA